MAEKKLLERMEDRIRLKHYSRKTMTAYVEWVRGGKGDKDRTVPLPRTLVKPLMDQMNIARNLWNIDRQRGMPVGNVIQS